LSNANMRFFELSLQTTCFELSLQTTCWATVRMYLKFNFFFKQESKKNAQWVKKRKNCFLFIAAIRKQKALFVVVVNNGTLSRFIFCDSPSARSQKML
jgi:hypothetical protein